MKKKPTGFFFDILTSFTIRSNGKNLALRPLLVSFCTRITDLLTGNNRGDELYTLVVFKEEDYFCDFLQTMN